MFGLKSAKQRLDNPPKHLGVNGKNSGAIVLLTFALVLVLAYTKLGLAGMLIIAGLLGVSLLTGIFFYPILMFIFIMLLMGVLGLF